MQEARESKTRKDFILLTKLYVRDRDDFNMLFMLTQVRSFSVLGNGRLNALNEVFSLQKKHFYLLLVDLSTTQNCIRNIRYYN